MDREGKKMVSIQDMYLSVGGKNILKDINFTIGNEILTVLGPSGCGKTSLLKAIIGYHKVKDGKVMIGGRDVTNLAMGKRNVSIVFQDYELFPHLTVFENLDVVIGNKTKVGQALTRFGMMGIKDRYPTTLSGGEMQRVAIARAVLTIPELLLLDEPFSNVDPVTKQSLERDIKKILKDLGIPTLIVTHNKQDAYFMSDRAIIMRDGRIEQINNLGSLYDYPDNKFVAGMLGEYNTIVQNGETILIRPEWIMVEKKDTGFKVVSCVFFGMYNRLIVTDGNINNTIIVYDFNKNVKLYDFVDIHVKKIHKIKN